jgi:hypothetical protein
VAGAVVGSDDGEDADVAATDDVDDADGEEAVAQETEGEGEGPARVAQAIADEFGVSQEEVLSFHEQGIGFGVLFKLYAIADLTDGSVADLLAAATTTGANGETEFAFGQLFNSLTEEQLAALEEGPKNLGQLVSASQEPDGAGSDAADEAASEALEKALEKFAAHGSEGHGPPEVVPAHGRN